MIAEILLGIIGFFLLIISDHFFIYLGLFSIWGFSVIYFYKKIKNPVFWIAVVLAGISIGVTTSFGVGTYLLSAGSALLFLYIFKYFAPEEYLLVRYLQYFLAFFLFYILRFVFGELSINGFVARIVSEDIISWTILSFISTLMCFAADKMYVQIRSGKEVHKRGVGIEIRRR